MEKVKKIVGEQTIDKSRWPIIENFSANINELVSKKFHDKAFGIIGRERELDRIIKNLVREDGTNILIVGPKGAGKRTLIHGLCQRIMDRQVPKKLLTFQFQYLDAASLFAGTKYRGQFEDRFKAISNELEKNENLILIVDNYNILTGYEYSWHMNILGGSKRLIILATNSEVNKLNELENDILSDYIAVELEPLGVPELVEILKKRQSHFGNYYNCKVDNEILYTEVINISDAFLPQKSQPKKSIDLLEELNSDANISRSSMKLDTTYNINQNIIECNNKLADINSQLLKIELDNEVYGTLLNQGKILKENRDKLYDQIESTKKSEKFSITIDYLNDFCSRKFNKEVDEIINRSMFDLRSKGLELNEEIPTFERYQASSILNGDEIKIQRGSGFVLIPHNEKFDEIFDTIIKPSMIENGLTSIKASDIYQTGSILNQVWKQIRTAEVIIADVSGQNSNVIFELGLCFAIKRSPILITQEVKALPFNIRNLRYIEYEDTAKGGRELSKKLTQAISGFLDSVRI